MLAKRNWIKCVRALDEHKETLAGCKAEAETIKQQNSALEQVDTALCPVCEQPLAPEQRTTLLQRNQVRLDTLRAAYTRAQQQVKTMEAGQKTLQNDVQKLQQELRRLPRPAEATAVQEEITAGQVALAEAHKHIEALVNAPQKMAQVKEQLTALGNPSQQSAIAAERARQRPQLEEKLTQIEATIAKTQEQVLALQQALTRFAEFGYSIGKGCGRLTTPYPRLSNGINEPPTSRYRRNVQS